MRFFSLITMATAVFASPLIQHISRNNDGGAGKPYVRLDKEQAAVLFVDHQTGLHGVVNDINPDTYRQNVLAVADLARYFKLPSVLTTSREDGPNGPILPQIREMHPDAPYIARPGEINAWDNKEFVQAVKDTGRKQLIISGIVTEVCVAFAALSALEDGYEVFIVTDASGTFNDMTREAAWSRMEVAGAQLMSWFGVACELARDWRNDLEGITQLFQGHIPQYADLIVSWSAFTGAGKNNSTE